MKCRHCGNKVLGDAKYCTLCGNLVDGGKTVVTRTEVENPLESNKKDSSRKLYYDNNTYKNKGRGVGSSKTNNSGCLIAFLIILFLPLGAFFTILFSFFGVLESSEFIEIGDEEIASLYYLYDDVNTCSYSSQSGYDEESISIKYCGDDLKDSYFEEYVYYLVEEEDFKIYDDYGSVVLIREAEESGYQIVVTVSSSTDTIKYEKVEDSEYDFD